MSRYCQAEQMRLFQSDMPNCPKYQTIPVYKVSLVRESSLQTDHTRLSSSSIASQILRNYLAGVDREHFVILMLDRKNRIIGVNTVSVGSLTASVVPSKGSV